MKLSNCFLERQPSRIFSCFCMCRFICSWLDILEEIVNAAGQTTFVSHCHMYLIFKGNTKERRTSVCFIDVTRKFFAAALFKGERGVYRPDKNYSYIY